MGGDASLDDSAAPLLCQPLTLIYDYEPIFIYPQGNESFPYRIVNAGLGRAYSKSEQQQHRSPPTVNAELIK